MYEQLTEDQWVERFGGYVDSPDDDYGMSRWDEYRHAARLNDYHREGRLWTIIEADNGAEYLIPGYHWVNRTGYVVSVLPYGDFDGEAEYMEPQCEACREFVDFGDISEDGRCGVCVTHEIYEGDV
jgi:hypothetical protein